MTIDIKCSVCKNADRRRAIELMWNGGMGREAIVRVVGEGVSSGAILRHLKEHADGQPHIRAVDVAPELPARERVLALQQLQLDEVERRITLAQQKAEMLNTALDAIEGDESPRHDWSEFFDILGKDGQSAISSILKAQGLTDKREKTVGTLRLGLFEAMNNAGLSPLALVGGKEPKALPPSTEEPDDD